MRYLSLFIREFQSTLFQERLNCRTNLMLQNSLRGPCDDEVIGISYDVYLEWLTLARCRSHACMDDIFQAIQRPIRKYRRDDPPLRGSCLRCEQGSLIDIPRSKPFAQNHLIHRHIGEQPIVTDIVEAASNVTFKYPMRRTTFRQCIEAMCDCIGGGSLRPKSIGVGICTRFGNRLKCQFPQRLHRTIPHRWNPQRTLLAIAFGYVDASQWLGPIAPML
ncbi:hypothetical protein Z046_32170 [Pseudomonas aeruginosa VRFPA09]|nr:hypothetical protein Z046_32170 [Pseudomonas aeruginosa VRFPA09]KYQ66684.1 hypothetical protein AXH09_26720 [Pseudomonas aeruginosa]OXZ20226.1 hypothetical protein ACG91_22665 [Pseudomonas aeruginosa]